MQDKKQKTTNILASSIVVAALIVAGAIFYSSGSQPSSSGINISSNQIPIPEVNDKDFILGGKNAEITIVEYADFSCSFCARYHPVMEELVKNYNGRLRWVYRHLPIFNKQAAVASTCVGRILDNNIFFEYASILYENQSMANNQDFLRTQALSLGVSPESFDSCISDKNIYDEINRDFNSARILAGINSTPYSIIIDSNGNMYPFSGALSYEEVSSLIDSIIR